MAEQKCDICRLCLGSIDGCDNILLNNNQNLIESILLITGLKVVLDQGQCEYLCSKCQSSLEQCVEFRVTCINNDGVFREMKFGSNHFGDCESELQKPEQEYIKVEPVDLGDPTDNDTKELERSEAVEPSIGRNRDSQETNQNGADVFSEMMITDYEDELQEPVKEFIELKPVDLGEWIAEVSEGLENNHMLPPAEVVESAVEKERKSQKNNKNSTGTLNPNRKVECSQCGNMVSHRNISAHQRIHVLNREKLCCPQCPKQYVHTRDLNRHINTHHKPGTQHTCDECGKSYISRESLKEHHNAVHNNGGKRYACTICGQKFTRKAARWTHQRYAHKTGRPFACEYCDKSFKTKGSLDGHTRLHTEHRRKALKKIAEDDIIEVKLEREEPSSANVACGI